MCQCIIQYVERIRINLVFSSEPVYRLEIWSEADTSPPETHQQATRPRPKTPGTTLHKALQHPETAPGRIFHASSPTRSIAYAVTPSPATPAEPG